MNITRVSLSALLLGLLLTGCASVSPPKTEIHDGFRFQVSSVFYDNVFKPGNYGYEITFPDGTTRSTGEIDDSDTARELKDDMIQSWLRSYRVPGTSPVIAGPPRNEGNLPPERPSSSDPAQVFREGVEGGA